MREIRRRTRLVGSFQDGKSTLMPAAARQRHVAGTTKGLRRHLDTTELEGKAFRRTV